MATMTSKRACAATATPVRTAFESLFGVRRYLHSTTARASVSSSMITTVGFMNAGVLRGGKRLASGIFFFVPFHDINATPLNLAIAGILRYHRAWGGGGSLLRGWNDDVAYHSICLYATISLTYAAPPAGVSPAAQTFLGARYRSRGAVAARSALCSAFDYLLRGTYT